MSLIEVTIATIIFVTVASAVMQFMVASRHLSSLGAAEDEVNTAGKRVLQEIALDLAQSGWAFPPGVAKLPATFAADRGQRYFPYVQQPCCFDLSNSQGLGTQFTYTRHVLDPDFYSKLGPPLPGSLADAGTNFADTQRSQYLQSYYARSQELIFVRLCNTPWEADPAENQPLGEKFGPLDAWSQPIDPADPTKNNSALGILYPSAWKADVNPSTGEITYAERSTGLGNDYGVPIFGGRLYQAGGDPDEPVWDVEPVWETMKSPDYSPDAPASANEPREFMYAVVASPSGLGRLVRAHKEDNPAAFPAGTDVGQCMSKDANYGMVVDRVLSEDVVRVVFDTYRTANDADDTTPMDLDINEIRVRLYLAKRQVSNPDVIIFNKVSCVLSMRSQYSDTGRGMNRITLGKDCPGFDF